MPSDTDKTTASEPVRITMQSRNQELLAYRDGALLLIYRYMSNRADAEDVLQEAYLKAVRAQSPLLGGAALRKWFFQIAANTAVSALRTDHRRQARERSAMSMSNVTAVPEHSGAEAEELKRAVEIELAALEEKYRTAISIHYEQGFSYDEASEILGVPPGTLRSYASQGLKMLRERLDTPARQLSTEALLALLSAGIVFQPSPASAAAISQIVSAEPVAKGAAGGAKVFVATGTGPGGALKAALAVFVLGTTFALGTWMGVQYMQKEKPVDTPAVVSEKPKVSPAMPVRVAPTPLSAQPAANPNMADLPSVPDKPGRNVKAKADYNLPQEEEALWANAYDLLKPVKVERDKVMGQWTWVGKELRASPAPFARLAIPCAAPEEYDLRVDFTRKSGLLDVTVIFGVQGKSAQWLMGALDGTNYCFGYHSRNTHIARAPALENGVRHTCIIQVRKETLTAFLDGKMIQGIELAHAPYQTTSNFRLPDDSWFGVGGWQADILFHHVAVREIKGKVVPADPEIFQVNNSEEYWSNTRILTPAAIDPAHILGGEWRLVGGKLSMEAKDAERGRYQFNYQPPQEYDMLVDFTRTKGNRGLFQYLTVDGHPFIARIDEDGMSGLERFGELYFYDAPATMHTQSLANNKEHRSIICVRKTGIRAYINGKLWLHRSMNYAAMTVDPNWALKSPLALGVGTHKANISFNWILVKEISGPGKELPPGTPQDSVRPKRPDEF